MSARVCVFGPLIDHTCGALFCPRGAEGPEDGDWDAYCTQCRAEAEAAEEYRDAEQVQMLNEFKYDEPKYERQQRAKAALDAAIAVYREGEKC